MVGPMVVTMVATKADSTADPMADQTVGCWAATKAAMSDKPMAGYSVDS